MLVRSTLTTALVALLLVTGQAAALAWPGGTYFDDDFSVHEADVEAVAAADVTRGCGRQGRFCPHGTVTRGQLAAFINRALGLPATSRDWFVDDTSSIFADDIDRLRGAGHTAGCNPPANDRYCPDRPVTRGEMAALLGRALGLPASSRDWFVDDDDSPFESSIDAFRAAGITLGCNPPANDRYCPGATMTRAQLASFLARALGLSAADPTPGDDVRPLHPTALRWDGIELVLPSRATELVGFHQSNHEGARDVAVVGDPVRTLLLPSRGRAAGRRSASDIVVAPDVEVRSPVTGTVVRAGTYTLYCDHRDDFVVIRPDGRPGIEVKLLHIDGVRVRAGQRVVAGQTLLAPRPTPLPFRSQVDAYSHAENWPHVHLEVIDTSIRDVPSGGGC